MGTNPILVLKSITKDYPGVRALNNISIDFYNGEVHCIVGENGAGKSTLVKILSGATSKDSGKIFIRGTEIDKLTPIYSRKLGIGTIFQESALVGNLNSVDNLFLGREKIRFLGVIDSRSEQSIVTDLFEKLNLNIDPNTPTSFLSQAQKKMVELAYMILTNAEIFIFDEPTAALDAQDVEKMLDVIERLKNENKVVIYISHKIEEVKRIGDRITVLRDGKLIATLKDHEIDSNKIISLMIGKEGIFNQRQVTTREITRSDVAALEIKNLGIDGVLKDITFTLGEGEILGVTGLVGCGKTELAEAIFGFRGIDTGTISIYGRQVEIRSPEDAIRIGMGMAPEDRRDKGLISEMSIINNLTLAVLRNVTNRIGVIKSKVELSLFMDFAHTLNLKYFSFSLPVKNLSGGNQQKVVLAKWLAAKPKILLLDEPTMGIDVGTKEEIYELIERIAESGIAIIVFSSEIEEILRVADSVIVLRYGRIAGRFDRGCTKKQILEAALMEGA